MIGLAGKLLQHRAVEARLRGLDRDLLHRRIRKFRQERIALRPHVDDRGIAEADVHRGRARHAVERGVERLQPVAARLLRPRLHVGLVDLHDVGAGREQVLDLGVDRGGVVERHLRLVLVEVVLRLLRHRERARHRDLDRALGVGAQEPHVVHFNGMLPPHLAGDARHRIGMAGAVKRGAGIVDVDTLQCGREAVGIALAPHLSVGDDVEAGALLVMDRKQRGVILRLREPLRRYPPQLIRPHPRRKPAGKLFPVDQPFRLGVGAHQ